MSEEKQMCKNHPDREAFVADVCYECLENSYAASAAYMEALKPDQPAPAEAAPAGDKITRLEADGSETWGRFFGIIRSNESFAKNPTDFGFDNRTVNQILDLLDVIASYSKELAAAKQRLATAEAVFEDMVAWERYYDSSPDAKRAISSFVNRAKNELAAIRGEEKKP